MKYINLIIFILYLTNISCLSRSLYLDKERCFYDNYYTNMNIVINYKILDKDLPNFEKNINVFKIYIQSFTSDKFKLFNSNKYSGKFSYNIEQSDKYKICIYTNEKELFKNRRFLYFQFKIHSSDEGYDENAAKGKDFQVVNQTMTKLNGKVETIEYMQKYQLDLEDKFSTTQINSSSRLAFISICQIIVICVVGTFHVIYLRRIFKDKIWTPF